MLWPQGEKPESSGPAKPSRDLKLSVHALAELRQFGRLVESVSVSGYSCVGTDSPAAFSPGIWEVESLH